MGARSSQGAVEDRHEFLLDAGRRRSGGQTGLGQYLSPRKTMVIRLAKLTTPQKIAKNNAVIKV
jgi:hypothetical protein